jgi:hypothetical protein
MCGDGDALRGAGTPFAIVAVDLLMLARSISIVSKSAAFTILRDFTLETSYLKLPGKLVIQE